MLEQPSRYNTTFLSKTELEKHLEGDVEALELNRVFSAYEMAENVHQFQYRNDGTPYFWHPTRVARILIVELKITDPDLVISALLHDTLEDSDILNPAVLEHNFGPWVAFLVETLTKEIRVKDGPLREKIDREYVERLMKSPEECRLIKLADRLDTMRCLEFNLKSNPFKYVKETSEHYMPMAEGSPDTRLHYLLCELQQARNKFLG